MKRVLITAGFACALALPQFAAAQAADQPVHGKPGATGQGGTAVARPAPIGQATAGTTEDPAARSAALSVSDKGFAMSAARGGMAEVAMGKLASDHAAHADVKQFGQRMIDDHGKAGDELKAWASKNDVTLPSEPGAKEKAEIKRLSGLNGAAFDRAYMAIMLADHNKDVSEFQRASTTAKNADLKAWAGKTLPTLKEHQQMARDVSDRVRGGSSAHPSAPAGHKPESPSGRK